MSKVTEEFEMMLACLKEAQSAAIWSFWRQRYNTNHPDHIRRQEIENPERYATANFYAAKTVYCANREQFDAIYETNYKGTEQGALFMAMRQVIESELNDQVENMLDPRDKKNYVDNEEADIDPDVDEDEEYVRQSQTSDAVWEGDELIGFDDFEDLEDDDIDWGEEE